MVNYVRRYRFPADGDVKKDIVDKYGVDSDIVDIYAGNKDTIVNKWHHYIPIYDRYFSRWRGKPVRFLEIGVSRGGSLQLWRKYFGEQAVLYGIDIEENCRQFDGQAGKVRIGSQADPEFLKSVVEEMGGVDVVLDDGSHMMPHVEASLKALYPLLSVGGTYMIEDLHTAYMENYGGGLEAQGNFFTSVRQIVDDMHRWYHPTRGVNRPEMKDMVSGIHIHDSIVVIDKEQAYRPTHSRVG